MIMAGEILKFDEFCRNELSTHSKVRTRENIYSLILSLRTKNLVVLEFGVAQGYTTQFFLDRLDQDSKYFGFDLFTGLPESWRNLKKGHFSNFGNPPDIVDKRLTWVIGDVNKTFNNTFEYDPKSNYVVLFDLDLQKPTEHVFKMLDEIGILKKGTILYFDEAFDDAELSVIKEMLLKEFKFKVLARTWSSIAFEILS